MGILNAAFNRAGDIVNMSVLEEHATPLDLINLGSILRGHSETCERLYALYVRKVAEQDGSPEGVRRKIIMRKFLPVREEILFRKFKI